MSMVPEVSAKVLFALSLILCQRLRKANERWIRAEGDAAPTLPADPSAETDADMAIAV
jgi:hypothetical protein